LTVTPGPTSAQGAGRRALLVEGFRSATTSTVPFNFSISPQNTLTGLATVSGINSVTPATSRAIAEGITNEVSGATGLPIFTYFDDLGTEITPSSGAVPAASLQDIGRVAVNFRVLGLSGKDQANPGATTPIDRRTASFDNDIYLQTPQNACA
jgi:hypothetical protein